MNSRLAAGLLLAGAAWGVAAAGAIERWRAGRQGPPTWLPAPSYAGAVEVRGAVASPGVRAAMAGRPVREALAEAGPRVRPRGDVLEASLAEGALVVLDPDGGVRLGWMAGERLLTLGLRVDLAHASPEDLQALPGIGPVIADRIARWRASRGPIRSVEALKEIPGIGPRKLEAIRPLLRIGGAREGIPGSPGARAPAGMLQGEGPQAYNPDAAREGAPRITLQEEGL
jgi:competence protein ComEA